MVWRMTLANTHNLHEIFDYLNAKYFNNRIQAEIRWTNFHQVSRWGFYKFRERLIQINQILNQDWVPRECVETVVFHEMCHQAYPPRLDSSGRREIHHEEFKAGELRYPNIMYWKKWRNKLQREKFNKQVGRGEDQFAENFTRFAKSFGLDPSDLGKSFNPPKRPSTVFTIIGLDPRRPKYPIRVKTQRGKVYVTTVRDIMDGLKRPASDSASSSKLPTRKVQERFSEPTSSSDSKDKQWALKILNKKRGRGRPSKEDSDNLKLAKKMLGMRRKRTR